MGLAIDRRTVAKGRIGVVADAAIALYKEELQALGFRRGSQRNGYAGDYFELPA
jgi:ribosomal protein S18 acetylase RimI-like enzyme